MGCSTALVDACSIAAGVAGLVGDGVDVVAVIVRDGTAGVALLETAGLAVVAAGVGAFAGLVFSAGTGKLTGTPPLPTGLEMGGVEGTFLFCEAACCGICGCAGGAGAVGDFCKVCN